MEEKNFEQSMQDLEKIVTELEKGDLNLDESVKKFEEGMKIAKKCNNMLDNTIRKRWGIRRKRFCGRKQYLKNIACEEIIK